MRDRVPMLLRSQGTKEVYPGFWHQNVSVTALIKRYPGSQKPSNIYSSEGKGIPTEEVLQLFSGRGGDGFPT